MQCAYRQEDLLPDLAEAEQLAREAVKKAKLAGASRGQQLQVHILALCEALPAVRQTYLKQPQEALNV